MEKLNKYTVICKKKIYTFFCYFKNCKIKQIKYTFWTFLKIINFLFGFGHDIFFFHFEKLTGYLHVFKKERPSVSLKI